MDGLCSRENTEWNVFFGQEQLVSNCFSWKWKKLNFTLASLNLLDVFDHEPSMSPTYLILANTLGCLVCMSNVYHIIYLKNHVGELIIFESKHSILVSGHIQRDGDLLKFYNNFIWTFKILQISNFKDLINNPTKYCAKPKRY